MLVEFSDAEKNPVWINPAHVAIVCQSVNGDNRTVVSTTQGEVWVLGTPAEVAAKLNGEAK